MSEARIAPTDDRQIIGIMNEFVFQAEGVWGTNDPDLFSMSMRLSELILGPLMKRHGTPADELAAFFGSDADVIAFPTAKSTITSPNRRIHQLKVTLRGTRPPIWRRIVIDGGETLSHLHAVIQAAFGWFDAHLHDFEIDGERYGIPDKDDWTPVKDERRVSIDQALGDGNRKIRYTYDFGDNWDHDISIEKTIGVEDIEMVPDCVGGRRACPPEDCGGTWGYQELLDVLADPAHPEHQERLEWTGGPIDPDAFEPTNFAQNLRLQRATGHQ